MSLIQSIKNNLKTSHLRRIHYLMGTFLSIEVFDFDRTETAKAIELAFNEVRRIEKKISRFREDSQIFQINAFSYLKPQIIDEELFYLIRECLEVSRNSGGAFDITVAPLLDLWSKSGEKDTLPFPNEIFTLLPNIGYHNLILDEEQKTISFKTRLLKVDLGAVGKGYALDRAVEVLKDNEISKARLNFGGQLYYFDQQGLGKDYIGIKNPLFPEEVILRLCLENKSISTSANYERNFRINNKIYSHIINPITGYPIDNRVLSVSVISTSAMLADIYSTALYILGLENGLRLIKDMDDIEAVIISSDCGQLRINVSPRLEKEVALESL